MSDSGAQLYLNHSCYYRQIGDLSMSYSVAQTISDEEWKEYLQGGLFWTKKIGAQPRVSLAAFVHAIPNAGQRQMLSTHMAANGIIKLERIAIMTNSTLLRGAMTAFGWLWPKMTLRAFDPGSLPQCLTWLGEVGKFDHGLAVAAWREAPSLVAPRP
jgi:hypothetical protein